MLSADSLAVHSGYILFAVLGVTSLTGPSEVNVPGHPPLAIKSGMAEPLWRRPTAT